MTKVIGVRFRTAGKVYFFDPLQLEIKRGDHVIVETARGIEFGTVVAGVHEVEDDKVIQPLKPVMRIAGERDIEQEAANKEKEKEAFKICKEKILKHGLEMKLIDAEYTFDNNKVLFYFTADGRIDFRELVKDLASVFKTRIELRQIGSSGRPGRSSPSSGATTGTVTATATRIFSKAPSPRRPKPWPAATIRGRISCHRTTGAIPKTSRRRIIRAGSTSISTT